MDNVLRKTILLTFALLLLPLKFLLERPGYIVVSPGLLLVKAFTCLQYLGHTISVHTICVRVSLRVLTVAMGPGDNKPICVIFLPASINIDRLKIVDAYPIPELEMCQLKSPDPQRLVAATKKMTALRTLTS